MTNNKLIQIAHHDGVAVVGSREVAENFGKEHKRVLENIRNLVAEFSTTKSMFIESTFENRGRKYKQYLMTRDGFSLLVTGFTGREVLHWKLKYIEAFNKMEEEIKQNPYNLPLTYRDALSHLLAKVEENEHLQIENAKLTSKAEYPDITPNNKGLIRTSTIAKDVGLNSTGTLNKILQDARVIYRDVSGMWVHHPDYRWLITDEYADYHSYDCPDVLPLLKWTEKGRQWIIDNFAADIDAEMAISK